MAAYSRTLGDAPARDPVPRPPRSRRPGASARVRRHRVRDRAGAAREHRPDRCRPVHADADPGRSHGHTLRRCHHATITVRPPGAFPRPAPTDQLRIALSSSIFRETTVPKDSCEFALFRSECGVFVGTPASSDVVCGAASPRQSAVGEFVGDEPVSEHRDPLSSRTGSPALVRVHRPRMPARAGHELPALRAFKAPIGRPSWSGCRQRSARIRRTG
jgi:hypothetical protein